MIRNLGRGLGEAFLEFSRPLDLAIAFFLSPLPKRYWRGLSGPGILLCALVQTGFSGAGLVNVYTTYAQGVSEGLAEATVEATAEGATRVSAAPAMAFGALTPLAFFAVSGPSWVLGYFLLSGLIRVFAYASDHPCGDPVLTIIDDLLWDTGRGVGSTARGVTTYGRDRWNG